MSAPIRLTQTVQKSGCAAKVAASELRKILSQVQFPPQDSQVLVDGGLFDDAAIYKVSDEIALVQTLDFFTPIVDSPELFGQIAAANSLSDIYAMGGTPKTAMAILAFPLATLENEHVVAVLQGASDKIREAGANFVGGHSIDDDTLKFGLSVTGFVHPQKVWSNAKAQVGDDLILTKALGTGTLMTALKRSEATEAELSEVIQSMAQLNSLQGVLSEELLQHIHAATDITGFGLLGHSMQMAQASQVSFEIDFHKVPFFPRVAEFIERSFITKAHRSNEQYVKSSVGSTLSPLQMSMLCDPQTSGGLLLSVPSQFSQQIVSSLKKKFSHSAVIGRVLAPQEKPLLVATS